MSQVFSSLAEEANMNKNFFPLLVKSIWSGDALEELYTKRKALNPSEENRTKVTMAITGLLFFTIMAFLLAMSWQRQDTDSYITSRQNIQILEESSIKWFATTPSLKACLAQECLALERAKPTNKLNLHSEPFETPDIGATNIGTTLLRTKISSESWGRMSPNKTYALTLPNISYRKASLYVNGDFINTSFDGTKVVYYFDPVQTTSDHLDLEILIEFKGEQKVIMSHYETRDEIQNGTAIMWSNEWPKYKNYLAANRAGRGNYVGAIARIVMAVFVLLLFLIIDGSPETLGLGLFLGFEAFAITTGYGWLPIENTSFIKNFAFQMGDIFRLYFFLQLARVIDKKILNWLIVGTLLSIPYGLLRHYGTELDIVWPKKIPRFRRWFIFPRLRREHESPPHVQYARKHFRVC